MLLGLIKYVHGIDGNTAIERLQQCWLGKSGDQHLFEYKKDLLAIYAVINVWLHSILLALGTLEHDC